MYDLPIEFKPYIEELRRNGIALIKVGDGQKDYPDLFHLEEISPRYF